MNQLDQKAILNMVAEGKITPEEGAQLLEALMGQTPEPPVPAVPPIPFPAGKIPFPPPPPKPKMKFLRVLVKGKERKEGGDEIDVDLNVPLMLARKIGPMLEKMIPEDAQVKMNESGVDMAMLVALLETIDEDMDGRDLVNVTMGDGEDMMKVRIYAE